jgi:hypothetical protein
MIHKLIALLLLAAAVPASAQVSFTGTPYVQNFNTLSGTTNNTTNVTWTDNNTLPGWYASKSAYHVTDATMGGVTNFDATSNANNIGLISFGSAGSAERALGSRATSTTSLSTTNAPVQYGVRLVNNTAQTITRFSVMFTGEQWYASTQSAAHTLQVDYSIGATSLTSGTYVSNFTTFTAPVSTGTTARALDGNAVANRRGVARLVTGVSWAPGQELWIRITDTNEGGNEQGLAVDDFVFTSEPNSGLFFDGATNHVTMGAATSTLGASVFTLEAWIFRTGTGSTTSTGSGGVTACPIVTKGRSQDDAAGLNCNYFLGINAANQLVADFEAAAASGITTGQNYPVTGASTIPYNQWVHVAATYDGGLTDGEKWKLFVNGVKDTTNSTTGVNPPANAAPEAISTQHFAIGTAMNSSGARDGAFLGLIDEVRLWNVARSETQIMADKGVEISTGSGLLARYGFGEGSGTTTASSVAGAPGGTLSGGPVWMHGKTFVTNLPPTASLTAPADLATGLGASVTLSASISDPESQPMTVTFYGRPKSPPVGPDFTLMTLPDTQFYSENLNNRFSQFTNQTNWIVSSRTALNTVFVSHMGDMVNTASVAQEWTNAKQAMSLIEDPLTTLLAQGIPWGGAPGNHDGTGTEWETHFGTSRWEGKTYFQGSQNSSNRNNYQFFSASGLDFIIIHLDYNSNTAGNQTIMDWADALLKAYPNRRAIVTSHWLIGTGNPAAWGGHGQAVYDNLKDNPNLFLMLCGHIHGEGRREDVFEGRTVHTVLQDYQSRSGYPGGFGGGDAWLRYFTFSPANNTISAKTYRTTTGDFETDADSQFTLPYTMGAGTAAWTPLGTVNSSGGTVTLDWTGLAGNTEYEWYAAVSDGTNNVGSSVRSFTTGANAAPTVSLTSPAEAATVVIPGQVNFTANAADSDGSVAKVEFYAGAVKVGEDTAEPFEYAWTAISGSYALTAVATDNQGASTTSGVVNITVTNPTNVPPSIAITAPTSGSSVPTGTVALAANASDTDGVVSKVEFFNGATEIGEDNTSPFTFDWLGVAAGSYTITAVATDNDGGTTTSTPVNVSVVVPVTSTLIAKGATWKFLDNGTDQGSAWKETSFNDSAWAFGPAVLGGGDTHIATTVNLGPASPNRYITTYFRRTFTVTGAAFVNQLNLNILRDDGVVVYINGTEVARQNMPVGAITSLTNAASIIGTTDETTYFLSPASPLPTLVDGDNTIAVEVHQRDGTSSDLGFDLELIANSLPAPPTVTLAATDASAGEFGADQAMAFTVTRTGSTTASLNVPLVASGSAASGVDYTGFLSSIAIPIGQASAPLPLTVLSDNAAEGSETATVTLGASVDFIAGTPASANGTITDKPEQGFYFSNIADPGKRAPGDDADGDNNANVIEYFMGSLPDDANSRGVLEIPTTGSNTFKVRYPRAKNRADVGGSLEWSGNLTSWHADGQSNGSHTVTFVEAVVSAPEVDPEVIEATATITGPGTVPAVFVRLAVE